MVGREEEEGGSRREEEGELIYNCRTKMEGEGEEVSKCGYASLSGLWRDI
jgi:hypothetical protein